MRWWVCWGILLSSSVAAAETVTCPAPTGGSSKLAALDASERIAFLHRTVDAQATYARRWKWAWFTIGSVTTASSLGVTIGFAVGGGAPNVQQANVIDNAIVSGFSLFTPAFSLLFALRVESDAPVIDALLRDTGEGTAGTCMVLSRVEELFAKDADDEAFNTGWFAQITAMLGLGAMFSIMAVEAASTWTSNRSVSEAHWLNAGLNTGVGLILTEAQILTTPTGAASAYKRYLKGELGGSAPKVHASLGPLPQAPGLLIGLSF